MFYLYNLRVSKITFCFSRHRLKSWVILENLVRKFDFEMVSSFVPKKHQKLMAHIYREPTKKKKIHLSEERSDEDANSGDFEKELLDRLKKGTVSRRTNN